MLAREVIANRSLQHRLIYIQNNLNGEIDEMIFNKSEIFCKKWLRILKMLGIDIKQKLENNDWINVV